MIPFISWNRNVMDLTLNRILNTNWWKKNKNISMRPDAFIIHLCLIDQGAEEEVKKGKLCKNENQCPQHSTLSSSCKWILKLLATYLPPLPPLPLNLQFSSLKSLSCVWFFASLWTASHQASLTITNSVSLLKFMSMELVMPSNHAVPFFSCLQSFPAWGSFPVSQLFASGGQRIGVSASASLLPMNIQDFFPLGLTGLISLLSKGFSRVFSSTTVQKNQFFETQPSLQSKSHNHTWLLRKPLLWLHGPLSVNNVSAF